MKTPQPRPSTRRWATGLAAGSFALLVLAGCGSAATSATSPTSAHAAPPSSAAAVMASSAGGGSSGSASPASSSTSASSGSASGSASTASGASGTASGAGSTASGSASTSKAVTPAASSSSAATAAPAPVDNLDATQTIKDQLADAYANARGLPTSFVDGTVPGSVFYAYDSQSSTYYAVGRIQPSAAYLAQFNSLPQGDQAAFQDGPPTFSRTPDGAWVLQTGGVLLDGDCAGIPDAVVEAWGMTPGHCNFYTPGSEG